MTAPPNRALWRAVHSLTHPAIVAAVIGLLINDHWLRYAHPSWLTGKLGDFTWLIFAPLIAAICFALVIPRRIAPHTRIVGWLSFGSVGLWFAAAKTIPAAHALTATAWNALVGWQGSLRLDPTDLLALPGLLIGAWVWSRADDSPLNLRPLAYVIAALGLVATLASDADYTIYTYGLGIDCLFPQDSALVTVGPSRCTARHISETDEWQTTCDWNRYTSQDGGLTWASETVSDMAQDDYPECEPTTGLVWPNDPAIRSRWQPGESIERSTDGGATWTLDYDLAVLRQDVRILYNHSRWGRGIGPLTGAADVATDNLVLAMGTDGILVRTAEGRWRWVGLGSYRLADLANLDRLGGILYLDWWLAGALMFLVITSSTAYIRRRTIRPGRRWALIISWLGWGVIWFGFVTAQLSTLGQVSDSDSVGPILVGGLLSIVLLIFVGIPFSIGAVWDIAHNFRRYAGYTLFWGVWTGLLYLLPLLLWTQGTIPRYVTAQVFSLVLTLAGLYAAYTHLRGILPILPGNDPLTEDSAAGDSDEVDGG